jgi:hypothetical protein
MNTTYRAVVAAFPNSMFPTLQRVFFTSEPEACALYTIEDLEKQKLLDRLVEVSRLLLKGKSLHN